MRRNSDGNLARTRHLPGRHRLRVASRDGIGRLMAAIKPKPENLAPFIFLVRGEKVLLDSDFAALYGVEARVLNQAVGRNHNRFPDDFMFQLTAE